MASRRKEDINNFPCRDLRTIDLLWVKHSNGKFGFSVQKEIYQSLGGTRQYNSKILEGFGDNVGWRQEGNWLRYDDLTFSLDTHYMGHLPSHVGPSVVVGWNPVGRGLWKKYILKGHFKLFSRAETCRL